MTHDDVTTLLDLRRDAVARRDAAALAALYSDSASLESPLSRHVVGADAIVSATWAFLEAFPDASIREAPPVIDGDWAAFTADVSGTHTGDIMGLAPTGRTFQFRAAFFVRIADGLIVEERRIYDFTGLLVQIGVLKAKPA